jgi:glycosyltransferase involved in cell wall biosynthesis
VRIAFDGRAFDSPAGGVRRYVNELSGAMRRVAPGIELMAVGVSAETALPPGVLRRPAAWSLPTNLGWAAAGLPLSARGVTFDVFHAPAYMTPLWGPRPILLTIHDVSYERQPEEYPYRYGPVRRAFYAVCARRADRVITDSEFSRTEIMAAYGIAADRIDVAPLGIGAEFTPDAAVPRELYVLHVGDLRSRRNLEMLLDVVIDLRRTAADLVNLRLVLAGRDTGSLAGLKRQAELAGHAAALQHVDRPADKDLVSLYRKASVFAYPSRYEGFGLPVLEAMACGTPVVVSSAGSVPEVAGRDALLVDPDDRRGWREALLTVLSDPARAAALGEQGRRRAVVFTWERTATLTLAAYRRLSA